ncbi:hypothetical protein GQ53DRAFT_544481 [Thozetella sp. PMI_491]|nr:hypothetical protein GQ53DRAFT_544481 [Thozetella sp. PMI_491]
MAGCSWERRGGWFLPSSLFLNWGPSLPSSSLQDPRTDEHGPGPSLSREGPEDEISCSRNDCVTSPRASVYPVGPALFSTTTSYGVGNLPYLSIFRQRCNYFFCVRSSFSNYLTAFTWSPLLVGGSLHPNVFGRWRSAPRMVRVVGSGSDRSSRHQDCVPVLRDDLNFVSALRRSSQPLARQCRVHARWCRVAPQPRTQLLEALPWALRAAPVQTKPRKKKPIAVLLDARHDLGGGALGRTTCIVCSRNATGS